MAAPQAHTPSAPSHGVHFYSDRMAMGCHVGKFILEGLHQRDTVFVVATHETHRETQKHLRASLPEVDSMPNYIVIDAEELLSNFLVDTKPDRAQFFEIMDRIFAKPVLAGRPIRVYGEMVVTLWHAGFPEAALQLEDLWNLLADRYKFCLLCAYPMRLFEGQDTQWFLRTCALHSHLSIVADSERSLPTSPI